MSAPPDTSYVRTPPIKSLIFKESKSCPSLILLASNFALVAGHPCGVPPRLRRGSPSGNKCPPEGGELAPLRGERAAPPILPSVAQSPPSGGFALARC